MHRTIIRKIPALSLLEVLIAGGILAMVLGSTVALGRGITRNQLAVQDRTLAYSLASEAAEIIRDMRDSTKFGSDKSFDSSLPANCKKQKCENLEIIWNKDLKGWQLEHNIGPGYPNRSIETDFTSTAEAIEYNLQTGEISDNTSRRKLINPDNSNWPSIRSGVYCSGEQPLTDKIFFCRIITLTPPVYDQGGDQLYDLEYNNPEYDSEEGRFFLPDISEENAADRSTNKKEYTFNSLLQNDYKIEIIIYWWEAGNMRQIRLSDSISNWQ